MWQRKNNQLYRKFAFDDFHQAFKFMQDVARLAEQINHHPRWANDWNVVEIWLSSHDAGNKITDKDIELSKDIDKLLKNSQMEGNEDEKTTKNRIVKLYADGGSRGNPGPSASGYALIDMNDKVLVEHGVYLGVTTNNQAEYQALKLGLEEAQKMKFEEIDVYMDSLLVVNQMLDKFKVRNRDLWPIHDSIKQLVATFKKVSYTHIPRELNKIADNMVNKALDEELRV